MTIKTWAKILPYCILEWSIRKCCSSYLYVLNRNPYDRWNNNEDIVAEDIDTWNVYEFSPYCKLIVSNKDVIQRKIEKREKEIRELKSELEI